MDNGVIHGQHQQHVTHIHAVDGFMIAMEAMVLVLPHAVEDTNMPQ